MALSDRHIVGVKSETTYGTDAFTGSEPTDFLGILGEPKIQELSTDIGPMEKTADGFGGSVLRVGDKTDVSFTVYMVGKGVAAGDTPPQHDALLKASNMGETVVAATSATYDLGWGRTQTEVPSMTVYEGIRDDESGDYFTRVVTGCRVVPTWKFEDGADAKVEFAGVGRYSTLSTATTAISNPSEYSGGKTRMKVQGMVFTYDGVEYPIVSAEVVSGMTIDEDHVVSAENSMDSAGLYLANGDKPGGSLTFKARSSVLTDILPLTGVPSGCSVPTAEVTITLSCGGDTITITGNDCAFGAHSKNLENSNYTFDVPLTFLGGLSVEYT